MKKLTVIFLLAGIGAQAQERIDTDRPDQTESAVTIPHYYFQGEFGFGKENYTDRNYSLIHPAYLLKYGIGKKIELRMECNWSSHYVHLFPQTTKKTVLEPTEIGTKIALVEEKGLRPKTSIIMHLGLPFTGIPRQRGQDLFPSFRFTMQNSITQNIGLGYNLGAEWDGYDNRPAWLYTFSPNFNIGKRWYAYIEAFGFIRKDAAPEHALDGGLAFYMNKDLKLDLSGGFGLGNSELRNYAALGFSFRFPLKR